MQSCVTALLNSFDKMSKNGTTFEARDPMGNFTMDVISKCAFATETNAHTDESQNPFLRNAKSYFKVNMVRMALFMVLPKFLTQWLLDRKVKPVYNEEFDFFENISRRLIKERRENKANEKFSDMMQLMVNAEHNVEVLARTFKEDLSNQADGHYVHAGKL